MPGFAIKMKRSIRLTMTRSRRITLIESVGLSRSSQRVWRAESENPPLNKAIDQTDSENLTEIDPIVEGHYVEANKEESNE